MKAPKFLINHAMFSNSDYSYLSGKGYTNQEIKGIWDRDTANGASPVEHAAIVDVVGYLTK